MIIVLGDLWVGAAMWLKRRRMEKREVGNEAGHPGLKIEATREKYPAKRMPKGYVRYQ